MMPVAGATDGVDVIRPTREELLAYAMLRTLAYRLAKHIGSHDVYAAVVADARLMVDGDPVESRDLAEAVATLDGYETRGGTWPMLPFRFAEPAALYSLPLPALGVEEVNALLLPSAGAFEGACERN